MVAPDFGRKNYPALLRILAIGLWVCVYGAVTLFGSTFQKIQLGPRGPARVHTPHFRSVSRRIRFDLFPFRSPLLGESQLFSFPPPIMMLRFSGFPIACAIIMLLCIIGCPIRGSPDQRLRAATRSLSQLVTPFIGYQAQTSTI